ncbi:MAG TPA: fumarate/nitrate reduction transcriptional regulator Fnr [Burkholderiales bacterium]|nr:fumarate/nitrate reduction transcriptional regulator Fnr [Burkholderiales bacterium]
MKEDNILNQLKVVCSRCSLRELCLPIGFGPAELEQLDSLAGSKKLVKRGEYLYRTGAPFASIYAVRGGFFKTSVLHEDGREHVTGFHMMGDIMGLDAISAGTHGCDAVALECSEICEIPFDSLSELSMSMPVLRRNLHRIMSREIAFDHEIMLMLGKMRAEERLAAFLLNLSQRFSARGYSAASFQLRMTREEIGSYLGLKLETVSRIFSKFQDEGLIAVQKKLIELKDANGLKRLVGSLA